MSTNITKPGGTQVQTVGISPKAILAAVVPTLGGIVAVLIHWLATGEFDRSEFAIAVSTVVAAVLAFIGAWAGNPGQVTPAPNAALYE
jgi:hypothetical protein